MTAFFSVSLSSPLPLLVLLPLLLGDSASAFPPSVVPTNRHQTAAQPTLSVSSSLHVARIPLIGRFRRRRQVEQPSNPIQVGESLAERFDKYDLVRASDGTVLSVQEIFGAQPDNNEETDDTANGKKLLVGMPGAFTTVCSTEHLPGYMEHKHEFAQLGYDTIVCVTTNDRSVNQEWLKTFAMENSNRDEEEEDGPSDTTSGNVALFGDGDGDFVKALGLSDDMGFDLGTRSKRFAMALDETGIVTHLLQEDSDLAMVSCSSTNAEAMMRTLSPSLAAKAFPSSAEADSAADGTTGLFLAAMALLVAAGVVLQQQPDVFRSF